MQLRHLTFSGTFDKAILRIALPAIVSNITVPLLGLVDTAIVGHLGSSVYIGAIAVGGMIFSVVYWLFGFLRAGTSGFASQALGAGCRGNVAVALYRSAFFALSISSLILLLQHPVGELAFYLINASLEVEAAARTYFNVCIWGAPAVILLYAFNGWFIGLQSTTVTMTVALVQNVANIAASLFFVYVLGMQVAGVALGTVLAQYVGLAVAIALWLKKFALYRHVDSSASIFDGRELLAFLRVNRDIFLRTLCILSVTSFFTAASARQGDLVLAANTVLLQFFYLFSYFMDGFSNAGEALAGHYTGAHDVKSFRATVSCLFKWGMIVAIAFTIAYAIFGDSLLSLLTNNGEVLVRAHSYSLWMAVIPCAGFAAFLWDGFFIGITSTGRLFLSMLLATILFFLSYATLFPLIGNHGLWIAFCLFLLGRGLLQTVLFPAAVAKKIAPFR